MSDNVKRGICIVSFDGGGPGTISQLSLLKELMNRLEYDLQVKQNTLIPADYFDLFGGVGWGIVSGVLLGLLRMTPEEAMDELAGLAHAVFPNEPDVLTTPEANMSKLRAAVEDMLNRRLGRVDIKLNDKLFANSRCKVVLFIPTTETMGHCHPFRSYQSRERGAPDCSVVDAICAALANPETFVPVAIGPPKRQQIFVGTPLGFSNPIRAVLEEARMAFGNDTKVALILSLGSGQSSALTSRSTMLHNSFSVFMSLLPRLVEDCERVAKEMARQLVNVEAYLRLSVDKGLEDLKTSDWHRLGTIVSHTDAYMQSPPIPSNLNKALELLQSRSGSLTLGELGQVNTMVAAKAQYQRQDCNLSLQIQDIARKVDRITMEKITFIDSVGNRVPIPMELCCSYKMLTKIIQAYFDHHRRLPGFRYVKRNKYQLVQGDDRSTIMPVQWDYSAIPGGTIEMSILVNSDRNGRLCPRCNIEPQSWRENEWVTCQYCLKQFKAIQNKEIDSDPIATLSPESTSRPLYPRKEFAEAKLSQEEIEEDDGDEMKKIRLISAIYKEVHASPLGLKRRRDPVEEFLTDMKRRHVEPSYDEEMAARLAAIVTAAGSSSWRHLLNAPLPSTVPLPSSSSASPPGPASSVSLEPGELDVNLPTSVSVDIDTPEDLAAVNAFLLALGRDVTSLPRSPPQVHPLLQPRRSTDYIPHENWFNDDYLAHIGLVGLPGLPSLPSMQDPEDAYLRDLSASRLLNAHTDRHVHGSNQFAEVPSASHLLPQPGRSTDYIPHENGFNDDSLAHSGLVGLPVLPSLLSTQDIEGASESRRKRRKFEELERKYLCGWQGCPKAYGALSHLNSHISLQGHGPKRRSNAFKPEFTT